MLDLLLHQDTSPHLLSSFCLTGLSSCLHSQDQLWVLLTSATIPKKISHCLVLLICMFYVTLSLDRGFSVFISGSWQISTFTFCHISICLSRFLFPNVSPLETSIWPITSESSRLDTPHACLHCVSQWPPLLCSSFFAQVCGIQTHSFIIIHVLKKIPNLTEYEYYHCGMPEGNF